MPRTLEVIFSKTQIAFCHCISIALYFLLTAFLFRCFLAFRSNFSLENSYRKLGFVSPGTICVLPGLRRALILCSLTLSLCYRNICARRQHFGYAAVDTLASRGSRKLLFHLFLGSQRTAARNKVLCSVPLLFQACS